MKYNFKKMMSLVLVSIALYSFTAGCGKQTGTYPSSSVLAQSSAADENASAVNKMEEGKNLTVLTAFTSINTETDALTGGNPNNSPVKKEFERKTGVTFKYIFSAPEDAINKLRLLLATRNVPDIFSDGGFSTTYPGGASKAAEDGIIAKLNPYLDTCAPNFKKVLNSKPEYEKNLKADNGDIYGFACFRANKECTVFFGPMIRKDILDKAGVPVPETIDEWHTALKALKDNGCRTPLSMLDWFVDYSGAFVGAYGGCTGYYIGRDNKIHFGAVEDSYKNYLELMNTWFKEGLIDPDFLASKDQANLDTEMISGKAGACLNWLSRFKSISDAGKQTNPDFCLVPTKYPVLKKGDRPLYAQADNPVLLQYFVGATGKRIKEAIRWYDFGYSEEGQMLNNFGIEGESYNMVDGKPVYTEMITKDPNPKGWNYIQSRIMYLPISLDAPTLESPESFKQLALATPEQKEAVSVWSDAQISSIMPLLSFTNSEQTVLKNQVDIDTYVKEATAKFILDNLPFSAWEEYVKHVGELGVENMLAVYNKAYERYKSR